MKLTERELHFLGLLTDYGATVARGLDVGRRLHRRYLVELTHSRPPRYKITPAGMEAFRTGSAKAKEQRQAKAAKEAQMAFL